MHYIITKIQNDGTRTTICGCETMHEAIEAARGFYEDERRKLRYVVDQVAEKLTFGGTVCTLQNIWDSDDVPPWD